MPYTISDKFQLINLLLDGKFAELLKDQRAQGASFETISRNLAVEHGVVVTSKTVQRWLVILGVS